ncbi:MAG: helix-turn-helix transcriptional regulator, partial [Nitrospirae bacterium]
MPTKSMTTRRSACPLSVSLEILGDRWSLLIIRDLMIRGYRTYKEFLGSDERIATNILADRLQKLEACGIITPQQDPTDRRKLNYRLTKKGIDLAPVLTELVLWAARYEDTGAPPALIRKMQQNREQFLAEVRQRWRDGGSKPIIPGGHERSENKEGQL